MICKHCGLEYPDDLEACPGCGTLNEEGEAQVMSEEERDAFDGVTIETGTDEENRGDWKVYDREDIRKEQEKEARKEKWAAVWEIVKLNGRLMLVAALLDPGHPVPAAHPAGLCPGGSGGVPGMDTFSQFFHQRVNSQFSEN